MGTHEPFGGTAGAPSAGCLQRLQGRRALFGSLRAAAAVAALAVGGAARGGLLALPVAAEDIEYCDVDPVVFVDVNGVRTGVKVHLGWEQSATPSVDRPATNRSLHAAVVDQAIVVTGTVVAPRRGTPLHVPTHMQIELLKPGGVASGWTAGTANVEMTATLPLPI